MRDQHVSHRPEAIAAAAWRTWIMNEQLPTAVPSTHLQAIWLTRWEDPEQVITNRDRI
jgi:hypothetical protein